MTAPAINLKLGAGVLVIGTGIESLQMLPDSTTKSLAAGFPDNLT